ncbi:DUF2252 family protein, partial [Asticcacaulis biprosthecium]|uniref:DUF2252 family protein n=1 Tax=Asticcacaulis biprosthecium TaxID=76891 RepID=UPI00058DDC87
MDPDRLTRLDTLRQVKMARSAHGFVRGSTRLFYDWVGAQHAIIPEGPPVWICGDCHSGNLGPLADSDGDVDIQICDLDQTVIGNPAHDLIRLSLSLACAARSTDFPGVVTARIIERLVDGYEAALHHDVRTKTTPPDSIRHALKSAIGQKWEHLAEERLDSNHDHLPRGKTFWDISAEERAAIEDVVALPQTRRVVLDLHPRDDDHIRVLDAAFWVKGTNSLGKARYAALLAVGDDDPELCLLDIKEAGQADTLAYAALMPSNPADRIVAGARALSPNLGERTTAASLLGKPVFVRDLRPQDLKLDLAHTKESDALHAAHYLAFVVGRAHARQMDDAMRRAWLEHLSLARSHDLDVPSWLWRCTVDLLSLHEGEYLRHCRTWALKS